MDKNVMKGQHGAWASYDVHPGLLYAGLTLPDGRAIQFFCNRETGLLVADVIDKSGKGGREVLRLFAAILLALLLATSARANDATIATIIHKPVPGSTMVGIALQVDVSRPELTLVDVITTTNEAPTGLDPARSITCTCKTVGAGKGALYPRCQAYVVEYGYRIEAACMTSYPGRQPLTSGWRVLR